ncbi:hypothetical protein [Psychromonas aquimarina]|uniref:hypothetical protein n=1 Tax=Psychromonas aquimarina TaxID=444919 RepID=UPI000426643D|nr:hypothetical protein [Psychromonas aquimarina]
MNISQKEKKLFEAWSFDRNEFVLDGVVDEDKFAQLTPSICFVLKDANGKKDDCRDLRSFLKEGAGEPLWDNISRWTHAIRHLQDDIEWSKYQSISKEFRINELNYIAAFNLKKSSGAAAAHNSNNVLEQSRQLIKEQFELYSADITVCCGTGGQLKWALGLENTPWQVTSRGVQFLEYSSGKFIVSFLHPATRIKDSFLHYALLDAVREIYL